MRRLFSSLIAKLFLFGPFFLVLPAWSVDWIGPSGGNWNDPANWMGGNVPDTIGETAEISFATATPLTVILDINVTIDSLSILNSLTSTNLIVDGVNLTLADSVQASDIGFGGVLTLGPDPTSQISGPANILINDGLLEVIAGSLNGTGTITVNGSGDLFFSSPANKSINDRTIIINSLFTWLDGGIMANNASIDISFGGQLLATSSNTFSGVGTSQLSVNGAMRRDNAVGFADIQIPLVASGDVVLENGDWVFGGSCQFNGAVLDSVNSGANFRIQSDAQFDGATLQGLGDIRLDGSTFTFVGAPSSISSGTNVISEAGAVMGGTDQLQNSGTLNLTGMSLTDSFQLVNVAGAQLNLNNVAMDTSSSITNQLSSTLDWLFGDLTMLGMSTLTNFGDLNVVTSGSILSSAPSTAQIINSGIITKSSTGNTVVNVPFTNDLQLNVNNGFLSFAATFDNNNAVSVMAPGVLQFVSGNQSQASIGTMTGNGSVSFQGGTFSMDGAYSNTGTTTVNGGVVNFMTTGLIQTAILNLFGGEIQGIANIFVNNSMSWDQGVVRGPSNLTIQPAATLSLSTTGAKELRDGRTLILEGNAIWSDGNLLMGEGSTLDNRNNFQIVHINGNINNGPTPNSQILNTGIFQKSAGNDTTNIRVPFVNNGDLRVSAGELGFIEPVGQFSGRTELQDANFDFVGGYTMDGGTFEGAGSVSGNVTLNIGFLKPGLMGIGLEPLSFQDNLTFGGMIQVELKIVSGGALGAFDSIAVSGIANLDGEADILFDPGYIPTAGDSFPLITAGTLNNGFITVNLPPPLDGVMAQANKVGNTFQIDIVPNPPASNPQLFLAEDLSDQVALVDPTNGVLNSLYGGFSGTLEFASTLDGSKIAVVNSGNDLVTLIDANTNARVLDIPGLGTPYAGAFNIDGSVLWVTEVNPISLKGKRGAGGQVAKIDAVSGAILDSFTDACLQSPTAISYSHTLNRLYVLSPSGSLCIFDTAGVFLDSLSLPTTGADWMEISPQGDFLIISSFADSSLFKVDADILTVTPLSLANPPSRMDFDETGSLLYVAGSPNQVLLVDTITMSQTGIVPIPGATNIYGLTVVQSINLGFVTDPVIGNLYSFTLDTLNVSVSAAGIGEPKAVGSNESSAIPPGGVRFVQMNYQVMENSGMVAVQIERVGGNFGQIEGLVTSADGTAVAGQDYQAISQSFQFLNGEMGIKTIAIPIIDDTNLEQNEQFLVNLTSPNTSAIILTPDQAVVEILEDEVGSVTLDQASYQVGEASGSVAIGITRTGPPQGEVRFLLATSTGEATAGFDFIETSQEVIFQDGEGGTKTVAIQILDDFVAEFSESFYVNLTLLNGPGMVGSPAQAHVTILDDDPVEVSFLESERVVTERDEGDGQLTVSLQVQSNRIADFPVFFNFQVAGTATPGLDHTLSSGSGLIPIGQLSGVIRFDILGDDLLEDDETLVLSLTPSGAGVGEPSQWTLTILDDERRDPVPRVQILTPVANSQWGSEALIPFNAEVRLEGDASVSWEICSSTGACFNQTGRSFARSLVPGRYIAICTATNLATGDVSRPAKARFTVVEGEPDAMVRIVFPSKRRIQVRQGATQVFRAESDAAGSEIEWILASNGSLLGTGPEITQQFDEAGSFVVIAKAKGSSGASAGDWREVLVRPVSQLEPEVEILSPGDRASFLVGESITFSGRVVDPDGEGRAIPLMWRFGNGETATGATVENVVFSDSGRFNVKLLGMLDGERIMDEITVFIQDPEAGPIVGISPATDLRIEPYDPMVPNSGKVFFRPVLRNARGYSDFDYFWDFGNGQTSRAEVPGDICYDEEGTFFVKLQLRAPNGAVSPVAQRRVTVQKTRTTSFEPNNSFEDAAPLSAGQYPNLEVDTDGVDFYRLTISRLGQNLTVALFENDNALVELFDQNRQILRSEVLGPDQTVQLVSLAPGQYFLKVTAAPGSKRLDIGYGLSIDVLNPNLYFPDVESSPLVSSELGIVNLSGANASAEAIAFDARGNLLTRTPIILPGNGRLHATVENLFPEEFRNVSWVQVDATADLVGYVRTLSRDGEELYATTASKKRSSNLFVPHIAERVDQWFTRAATVNVDAAPGAGTVETPGTQVPLALDQGFGQDKFEFIDRFGGALPEDGIWALLRETSARANLVGIEVFGTKDGSRQVAGLELVDNQRDNPNFVYVANNLYFTHIASDLDTFYTGIALVNVGTVPQSLRLFAYRRDGAVVGPKVVTLGPNEKLVSLADELLSELGSIEETTWVLVEADSAIAGFEIFGTKDGKRLAGLEATNALRTQLCYPYIDVEGKTFHGVSFINPNLVENPMTLTLYDDQGSILATQQMTLAPGQKWVSLMRDVFPEYFNGAQPNQLPGWLGLEAQFPTAGFELFTSKDSAKMGAILAQ